MQDFRPEIERIMAEAVETNNFIEYIGLKLENCAAGKLEMSMTVEPTTSNGYGTIHGGALASLMDTCLGLACFTLGKRVVTEDMHINYLKAIKTGDKITAKAEVIHNGAKIVTVQGIAVNSREQVVCQSTANFYVIGAVTL